MQNKITGYISILVSAGLFLSMSTFSVVADDIPAPTGETILTISGLLENPNVADTVIIDMEMIKNLPSSTFTTDTIWTDEANTYTGVSLHVLMDYIGASGTKFRAVAINDYAVEIPLSDAVANGPIIAYEVNGERLSPRDKGPLWIIYPFDNNEEYRKEQIYARSIWQLDRIELID